MSRVIKQYPYSKVLDDESYLKAESVQNIKLPVVKLSGIELLDTKVYPSAANGPNIITVSLQPKIYAKEDEKGIFMYLVEIENGEETDKKSEEIVIDEEAFADSIFKAMEEEISFDESFFLREILSSQLLSSYTDNYLKRDIFLLNTRYAGFGVILSGETVIGTVDCVKLQHDNSLILSYCVGNFDLNNIANCNVVFKTHNIWLNFFNIDMEKVICDNDYFCTYVIRSHSLSCNKHENLFNDIKEFPTLVDFSEGHEEEFLEQRSNYIESFKKDNEDEQARKSYLDELL